MLETPHPYVSYPFLWARNVPPRVNWARLAETLSACGTVHCVDSRSAQGDYKSYQIDFKDVETAELALALYQRCTITVPGSLNFKLSLSPSLSTPPETPTDPPPQFVKCYDNHPLRDLSFKDLFAFFRHFGPLVYLRRETDVGYPARAIVVRYWSKVHALTASRDLVKRCTQNGWPPSFLQPFDPCNLFVSNLDRSVQAPQLHSMFTQFGKISRVRRNKKGRVGFVGYDTQESARNAMSAMNGTLVQSVKISVRVFEIRPIYHLPEQLASGNSRTSNNNKTTNTNTQSDQAPAGQSLSDEPPAREAPQGGPEPDTACKDAARRTMDAAQAALDAARDAENNARGIREVLEERECVNEQARAALEQKLDQLRVQIEELRLAERTAQASLKDVTQEEGVIRELRKNAQSRESDAESHRLWAEKDFDDARQRWAEFAPAEDADEKEANAKRAREEEEREHREHEEALRESIQKMERIKREEELAKSRRKIAELNAQEAARKLREQAEKARRDHEELEKKQQEQKEEERRERERIEALRHAREEEERKAEELRNREAKERAETAKRLRARRAAAEREKERCTSRDETLYAGTGRWSLQDALDRYRLVSEEFDKNKFDDTRPLVFESVPWPVRTSPFRLTIDDIEWTKVKSFFQAIQRSLTAQEYRELLQKSQRRFHPDRWRSRGLLNSVVDDQIREQLEVAGNAVSQQVTELYSELKRE